MYKNRNLCAYIAFVINPRENFDFVASGSKKSGIKGRERIRKRVKDYNNGSIPKELGFFGDEDNRECRQYTLQEEREIFKVCPFRFSAKKGLR